MVTHNCGKETFPIFSFVFFFTLTWSRINDWTTFVWNWNKFNDYTSRSLVSLPAPGVQPLSLEWSHCVWAVAANCPERSLASRDWRPPSVCSPSFCRSNFFHRFGRKMWVNTTAAQWRNVTPAAHPHRATKTRLSLLLFFFLILFQSTVFRIQHSI